LDEAAGAVFDVTANLGWVPDQRAANGRVTADVKKATRTTKHFPLFSWMPIMVIPFAAMQPMSFSARICVSSRIGPMKARKCAYS
jgi:hypothetical protein